MFYQLPPVGNPIRLFGSVSAAPLLRDFFSPYTPRFFCSGTAALAAAIGAAIRLKAVDVPEVILPAYGCPDLVSAAVFAGAKPILVDLVPERPWMDFDQLSSHINTSTVAIIAVNLFAIPERMVPLRKIADQASVLLIEDSAQAFPVTRDDSFWDGDLVVLSFGRGKPVSLLGGGAVLFRDPALDGLIPEGVEKSSNGSGQQLLFWLQAILYNLMISPRLYWIPQGLPLLHLGETRYQPLASVAGMDPVRLGLLRKNINKYHSDNDDVSERLTELATVPGDAGKDIIDLPVACRVPRHQRLLRYPLLVQSERRDSIYQRLRYAGLGASRMYPSSLPGIPGLEVLLDGQADFPAAEDFSRRLLTLPTHTRLRSRDIRKMRHILKLSGD